MSEIIGYYQSRENFIRSLREEDNTKHIIDQLKTVNTSESEERSWLTSLPALAHVLNTSELPQEITIALEYKIPITERRIDTLLTGYDNQGQAHAIIIEMKAWNGENCDINTIFYKEKEYINPCYQAFSYEQIFKDYNEAVQNGSIRIHSLVYMYGMSNVTTFRGSKYVKVFGSSDITRLRHYIACYLQKGDKGQVLKALQEATINFSTNLKEATKKILGNNFILLDEQKTVFDKICEAIDTTDKSVKKVIVVQGDAGTGKTIIAASLLAKYMNRNIQYATPNPFIPTRWIIGDVLEKYHPGAKSQLVDLADLSKISTNIQILLIDEAQKIMADYTDLSIAVGNDTIHSLIERAPICVFFCDPYQITRRYEEGYVRAIQMEAEQLDVDFQVLELGTQYRCNGSTKYLDWLFGILELEKDYPKFVLDKNDYDFIICNSPSAVTEHIRTKQKDGISARVLIGNCYEKLQTAQGNVFNDEYFHWELTDCRKPNIWAKDAIYNQTIGTLYHCAGLEFDYIGVIICPDLFYKNKKVMADSRNRFLQKDYDFEEKDFDMYGYWFKSEDYISRIKNLYYTLLTRGMRGCYVYFCDKSLEMFFRRHIQE